MNKPPPKLWPMEAWVERYEQLRRHFLENSGTLVGGSLALQCLLVQGVAGWMKAWEHLTEPDCPPASPIQPLSLVADWRQDITSLLTQMGLAHLNKGSL